LPGGRPSPRPIEIDSHRTRIPTRDPGAPMSSGRPYSSTSPSTGSLGGPIDDLFSRRDPHSLRPSRPSNHRPTEYMPELSARDAPLDHDTGTYPRQHSSTKGESNKSQV
jgi:hypothetical protein